MSDKKILSIDEMLAPQDIEFMELDVPQWGGTIRLGSLPADSMMEWVESADGPAKKTAAIRLIIKSLVDAEGNRIGDESKHLAAFKKRSASVLNEIAGKILELNKLNKEDQEKTKNALRETDTAASPTSSVLH